MGERCIWVVATYQSYRAAWKRAAEEGLVDALEAGVDVDHVFPQSWAKDSGMEDWWLRLHPVYQEVNRSAGGGREKARASSDIPKPVKGVVYARELQVLKILNHPVSIAEMVFAD